MQEISERLIDEALANEPVKNTFRLGWEFVTLNRQFTITAMIVFIVLNMLASLPMVSVIFMVFASFFGTALQIHIGRSFYEAEDISTYLDTIKQSTIEPIISKHLITAVGVYLGWVVLLFIMIMLVASFTDLGNQLTPNMGNEVIFLMLIQIGLPLLLIAVILSYVHPLVESNIIMANSLQEGFKAVFTIFSLELWRRSFQGSYFKYVASFGLVIMGLTMFGAIVLGLFQGGILGIFADILLVAGMYILMVFIAIGSMMARRIVE